MSDQPAPRTSAYSRVSLAIIASAGQANLLGNIHGGDIVKLADSTAGAVAYRHSDGPAVTAVMDEVNFLAPVHVGDIIKTYGQVNWVGSSSMEIGVRVETQPWGNATDAPLHVASAYFVFVAIDDHGAPRPVPGLGIEMPEDARRNREALIRRANRLARKQEIERARNH